jgi:hypothetical protein
MNPKNHTTTEEFGQKRGTVYLLEDLHDIIQHTADGSNVREHNPSCKVTRQRHNGKHTEHCLQFANKHALSTGCASY